MFNARKPEAAAFPGAVEADRSHLPGATTPKPYTAYNAMTEQNCSIINEWLTMRGDLESQGDILIRGKVHGSIMCKLLIIDTQAAVEGGIDAEEVIIRGATRGTIKAKRVRIEKTANIDSEIVHESFAAEEGARIRGALRHIEDVTTDVVPDQPVKKPAATKVHHLDSASAAE
jgi:cytoskeletal protein CcmA (bactofilin family)